MKTGAIIHENGNFFVMKMAKGYKVFQNGVNAALCRDTIGSEGPQWLAMAIGKCDKRATDLEDSLKETAYDLFDCSSFPTPRKA